MRGAFCAGLVALGSLIFASGASAWCCGPMEQLAITSDGLFGYANENGGTQIFSRDPETGALRRIGAEATAGGTLAVLSPDDRVLYVTGPLRIRAFTRDEETGVLKPASTWSGGQSVEEIADIAVNPAGTRLYATDGHGDALLVFATGPGGKLTPLGTLQHGVGGVDGLGHPGGMALAPGGRYLYVAGYGAYDGGYAGGGVSILAVRDDGGLQYQETTNDRPYEDVEVAPDGKRLYAGSGSLFAYDRSLVDGGLTYLTGTATGGGNPTATHGGILVAPDGKDVYFIDSWNHNLRQAVRTADGLADKHTYREGVDGARGLRNATGLTASPDGKFVYVTGVSYPDATIAVYRRDPATNMLRFSSILKHDPSAPAHEPGVVIDGGDRFTRDPHVKLRVYPPDEASAASDVEISNDGGFGHSKTFERAGADGATFEWMLARSGPEKLAKTVYVRFAGVDQESDAVFHDDIVLDETAPTLVEAKILGSATGAAVRAASARRLVVRARDKTSGVSRIQIAQDREIPGAWHRFKKGKRYALPTGRVYVRVRDRAGNRSRWRRARSG